MALLLNRRGHCLLVLGVIASCAHATVRPRAQLRGWITPVALSRGQKATLIVEIRPPAGAHLSKEAPLTVQLEAKGFALHKTSLSRKDGQMREDLVRFEVPVIAVRRGPASLEAIATYFTCTANACIRQTGDLSLSAVVK